MTDRRTRSCTSKFRYSSSQQARRAVKDLVQRTGTKELVRHYSCEFCKGWHIGRSTKYILSRVQVVAPAPAPKTLNWGHVTAKLGPDCEGDLFVHFEDDEGNHAYLTIEGRCHVLVMPKGGASQHGDNLAPLDAFRHLTGIEAEGVLDVRPGYFDEHNARVRGGTPEALGCPLPAEGAHG